MKKPMNEIDLLAAPLLAVPRAQARTAQVGKLIDEMCPDGVEFKALGDTISIMRGASPMPIRSFLTDDKQGFNWIKIDTFQNTLILGITYSCYPSKQLKSLKI